MNTNDKQTAFTLVELAIVLVILGLLAGGVMYGQNLIRAAELRSITADSEQFKAAVMTFRDQYLSLPGDTPNATQFWGSAGGDGSNAACIAAQSGASNATCNGDANGMIMSTTAGTFVERFLVWKHLANAGLVSGNYTGKTTGAAGTYSVDPGANVMTSKISNGFWDISLANNANFALSNLSANSVIIYGNKTGYGLLLPEEAWSIDSKMDDGKAATGQVITTMRSSVNGGNCATDDTEQAEYDFTITAFNCLLAFLM